MWQIRSAYLILWRRADEFICSDSRIASHPVEYEHGFPSAPQPTGCCQPNPRTTALLLCGLQKTNLRVSVGRKNSKESWCANETLGSVYRMITFVMLIIWDLGNRKRYKVDTSVTKTFEKKNHGSLHIIKTFRFSLLISIFKTVVCDG